MKFSHIDKNKISMVDISKKKLTMGVAKASCLIKFSKNAFQEINKNNSVKGDIFNTARCSGITAAKKTSDLIPLCHNLPLNFISIDFKIKTKLFAIEIISEVRTNFSTGVEMEALTACSVSGLVIYDMCKAIDKRIIIDNIKLLYKKGGKSRVFKND